MQSRKVLTNRHKKASDGQTSKASHLTVVSQTGNRPMKNNTAEVQNNQLPNEIALIIYQAKSTQQAVWSSSRALHTLGTMIKEGVNKENLKGIGYNIELLADNLMDWGLSLEKALTNGGYGDE